MRALALLLLALLVAVTTTSATVRLARAASCDAPACDSTWPHAAAASPVIDAARALHRLAASGAGLVVVALLAVGWRAGTRGERASLLTLGGLALGLATLGRAPPGTAVTLGNLLGGMAMVGLAAWLAARKSTEPLRARAPALRAWLAVGIALTALLVALAAPGTARTSSALPHAGLALAVVALLAWLGIGALRAGAPGTGIALLSLASLQVALGTAAALAGPVATTVAVAHNAATAGVITVLATLLGRSAPQGGRVSARVVVAGWRQGRKTTSGLP